MRTRGNTQGESIPIPIPIPTPTPMGIGIERIPNHWLQVTAEAAPEPHVGCLTNTSWSAILICMKTTLNIDDGILAQASRLTGVDEKTALVRMGLEALVARYSARRLAALGGSEPAAKRIPRRRTA
jgi:Arc/MetJ family transcription regulator